MAKLVTAIINYANSLFILLKNLITFNFKKPVINNSGISKISSLVDRSSKYKFYLYIYIFITMVMCPWLDNLANDWLNSEPYSFYYMFAFLFLLNFFLNYIITIPSKNTLDLKVFSLKLKSFYFYINWLVIRFSKVFLFFKNEIILKGFSFNFVKTFLSNFCNYFIYWRPLFKRFSYFGFYRLTKSKFFKNVK
jgi:hypothetical protein